MGKSKLGHQDSALYDILSFFDSFRKKLDGLLLNL